MFRCVAQALAIVSALTGCVAAPPKGAFVEYGPDLTPITRPSPCRATYALVAKGPGTDPMPLTVCEAMKGERIGFRRTADGSVEATWRDRTFPLPPDAGPYAWEVVPGSYPSWRERFWEAAWGHAGRAVQVTGDVLLMGVIVVTGLGLVLLYAYAKGKTPGAGGWVEPRRAAHIHDLSMSFPLPFRGVGRPRVTAADRRLRTGPACIILYSGALPRGAR